MLLYAEIFIALIRYFSNYLTLHRSDLAAWAAPLDPHLFTETNFLYGKIIKDKKITTDFMCKISYKITKNIKWYNALIPENTKYKIYSKINIFLQKMINNLYKKLLIV